MNSSFYISLEAKQSGSLGTTLAVPILFNLKKIRHVLQGDPDVVVPSCKGWQLRETE